MDSPSFARDLERAEAECKAFAADLSRQARRRLPAGADAQKRRWTTAIRRYEALEDLLGRIISYAGLVYAGDTTDPQRAKFYGDAQEKLTAASSDLLFFPLELNRLDDALLDAAWRAGRRWPLPAVARGHPQGEALPARRQARAALPREVGHRPRRLEPPVRRDHRGAALRRRRRGADARADAQPAAGRRRRTCARPPPRRSATTLGRQPAHLHAHHQHARQGQGNLRPLARLRGRRRLAAISSTASSARSSTRWSTPCATPIRACRTAITR